MGNLSAGFSARKLGREQFARQVTALFENMRILKFKSQLTIAFFAAVNHLNGVQKVMVCDLRLAAFPDPFCVFLWRFVACDRNYDWWERKTQLSRGFLNFGVRMFVKSAVKHGLPKFFLNICVHSTRYKRVQSLDRLNWESNSPVAQNKEQKSHTKAKRHHFSILLRINFASIFCPI